MFKDTSAYRILDWLLIVLVTSASITLVSGNEILADTFQQIDMRDHALFQLIIGTVAIVVISVFIIGFMIIFQCYSSYCHNQTQKKYELTPLDDSTDPSTRLTLSFRSVFQQEEITQAV